MNIKMKFSVVMNVTVEAAAALGWISAKWDEAGLGLFLVTSAKDGQHAAGSQHRQDQLEFIPGEAFDIHTRHHFNFGPAPVLAWAHSQELIAFARMLQKAGFHVVVHPDWMPELKVPPHLHVGVDKPIFAYSEIQ